MKQVIGQKGNFTISFYAILQILLCEIDNKKTNYSKNGGIIMCSCQLKVHEIYLREIYKNVVFL